MSFGKYKNIYKTQFIVIVHRLNFSFAAFTSKGKVQAGISIAIFLLAQPFCEASLDQMHHGIGEATPSTVRKL